VFKVHKDAVRPHATPLVQLSISGDGQDLD